MNPSDFIPTMNPATRDAGFELIACGLLLGVLGWLLHRADPTYDVRLPAVALVGAGCCLAAGLLAYWRTVNLRWCASLLFALSVVLGWQTWRAWEAHLANEGSYRPVPVMTSVLCLLTVMLGGLLWHGGDKA